MNERVLTVEDLRVALPVPAGTLHAVQGVSFHVDRGETLCIVGESGCGKTLTALAVMDLLPARARRTAARLELEGRDLARAGERAMADIRGNRMAMIFQEPMTSLNPVLTVGSQVAEAVRVHQKCGASEAWKRAIEALERVRIPDAPRRAKMYPHQLSGGMRQRVMIAMALVCRPQLIIADEPTTALDVTIQAQILALLSELQEETGTAIVLITHDLGVVCETADRVVVLYAGARAEEATVEQLFDAPAHPYTRGLMASIPRRVLHAGGEGRRLNEIAGTVPTPDQLPPGCAFAGRCPRVLPHCAGTPPVLHVPQAGHEVACFNPAFEVAA
jgi:peptide/nickel transport system ATP-binding protein